jgi:translocator protein
MSTEVNSYYYYGSLAAWIVVIQAVGGITGYFIKDSINNWYKKINRAPLNPPDWVFPIAWTILYVLIAVAGWRLQFAQSSV